MTTHPQTDAPATVNARRAGGERTRRRLIEAAQELIAERGESAIRLRDLGVEVISPTTSIPR